jgi:hypothetical protein
MDVLIYLDIKFNIPVSSDPLLTTVELNAK